MSDGPFNEPVAASVDAAVGATVGYDGDAETVLAPRRKRWPIVVILGICATIELGMAPFVEHFGGNSFDNLFTTIITCMGIAAAQVSFFSGWLTWSWLPFWRRLLVYWSVAVGLWTCWLIGAIAVQLTKERSVAEFFAQRDLWQLTSILPVCSLAVQAPLWCLRLLLGYRMIQLNDSESPPIRRLSIADLLATTTLLACRLACLRMPRQPLAWPELAVVLTFATIACLVLLPLPAWLLSQARSLPRGMGAAVAALSASAALLALVLLAFNWDRKAILEVLGPMFGAASAVTLLLCVLARVAGYRVVTRWSKAVSISASPQPLP